jgi:thiamine biosynthesis lipoprotein ApbE
VSRHRFDAMGCEVVLGDVPATAARAVEELFWKREQVFSRFIADSELNRVNGAAGRPVETSQDFAAMLRVALDAAAESDGLVDPTLGAALVAAGYDADMALLRDDGTQAHGGPPGRWRSVRLIGRHVFAPAGVELDLNGVVKGATVDDALTLIGGRGWVSAGGDLAARAGVVVSLPGWNSAARTWRAGDQRHGPPPVDARRAGSAPPHRPSYGRARELTVALRDRLRRDLRRRRRRGEDRLPAG